MKRFVLLFAIAVVAGCAPNGPSIGISSYATGDIPPAYTDAVAKGGGVPVVMPVVSSREEADAIIAAVDGVLFSGGEDINPAWYGEEVLNETVEVNSLRDFSDSLLVRAALASGKPILAICRGEQLMNVLLGGSLYQDIPSQVPETVGHSGTTHKIGIEEGSILANLFGTDSLEVNSTHHQAVKDVAPGLTVTAYSSDGIVEAYEGDNLIAVQFHPEKLVAAGDDRWLELFELFISRCE